MPVFDQTADTSFQELHRFAKLYPFPDWVKKASPSDAFSPPETVSAAGYADSRSKQFPCHTKAATFFSTLYFLENKAEIPTKIAGWIDERLQKFAGYWGITNTLRSLREKHAELHTDEQSKLPDSAFALVRVQGDGTKSRQYMLRNAQEVKVASQWLHDNRETLPFLDRRTIAAKILEKASQFGASLHDQLSFLERQAGRGVGSPKDIAEMIRMHCKEAERVPLEVKVRMGTLAKSIEDGGQFLLDGEKMASVCAIVEDFDRVYRIDRHYGDTIKRPEDVIFAATFKEATAFASTACELQNGSVYEPDQFEKLSLTDVEGVFGEEFADQVCTGLKVDGEKMATLARTLPRGEADVLERLLSDSGMTPVVKHAAAVRTRVSRDLLKQAAAQYKPVVTGRV